MDHRLPIAVVCSCAIIVAIAVGVIWEKWK